MLIAACIFLTLGALGCWLAVLLERGADNSYFPQAQRDTAGYAAIASAVCIVLGGVAIAIGVTP